MSHRIVSIGLIVGVSLLGIASASAADLDYGYGDAPPIPEQKVEFGTGWYIRGDIAAVETYTIGTYQPPDSLLVYRGITRSHNVGYDLSAGGGYQFTNAIRTDITVDFHQPISTTQIDAYCYNSTAATCRTDGKLNHYDALINGYYDFGRWNRVTPYLGAGVGVAFGQAKSTLTGTDSASGDVNNYINYTKYHNLAWALMAGVSLDVFDHTKLDIGYRYLNNGTVDGASLYYHEIRAGLRYLIDDQ